MQKTLVAMTNEAGCICMCACALRAARRAHNAPGDAGGDDRDSGKPWALTTMNLQKWNWMQKMGGMSHKPTSVTCSEERPNEASFGGSGSSLS